ncbi:MAG: Ig-like domain-containing protein, partial [Peptococcaceae bacterium]|nr:Ig-like domain-containing protein [Peptococcaceae bacterium]
MNYFLKKKKWMACLVLLTFLFTSIMPTNLAAGDSMAWAADYTVTVNGTQTINGSGQYRSSDHKWTSSDDAIATVSGDSYQGTVTGHANGEATITHTYKTETMWGGSSSRSETWTITVTGSS